MSKQTIKPASIMIMELPGDKMAAVAQGTITQMTELLCAAAKKDQNFEDCIIVAALVTMARKGKDLQQIAKAMQPMTDEIVASLNKKK